MREQHLRGELVKQNGNWYVSNSTGPSGIGSGLGTPATADQYRSRPFVGPTIVAHGRTEVFDWDEWEHGKVYQLSNDEPWAPCSVK